MRRPEWSPTPAPFFFFGAATRLKRDTLACLGKMVNKCVTRESPASLPRVLFQPEPLRPLRVGVDRSLARSPVHCEPTLSRDFSAQKPPR